MVTRGQPPLSSALPSIVTWSVTCGRAVTGWITCGPAPARSKTIVSANPIEPFESRIAWRSEPAPASAVVVTVYVAARAAGAAKTAVAISAQTSKPRLGTD